MEGLAERDIVRLLVNELVWSVTRLSDGVSMDISGAYTTKAETKRYALGRGVQVRDLGRWINRTREGLERIGTES